MFKQLVWMIVLLAFIFQSDAAIIHGTIYDINLNSVDNAIVEINTTPTQRIVSIDGKYSFELMEGSYEIIAFIKEDDNYQKIIERVDIEKEGTYVIDLFLYYDNSFDDTLFNVTDVNLQLPYKRNYDYFIIIGLSLLAIIFLFIIFKLLNSKNKININQEPVENLKDNDLEKIISIIKKQGSRATQKEIRKEIPLSEAKISLMISQLESEGKIKKIKKGRGNIIVLDREKK